MENFHLHFDEFFVVRFQQFSKYASKNRQNIAGNCFLFFLLLNIGEEVLGFSISDEGRIFVAPQIEPGDKGCNEVLAFKYDDGKGNNDGM